VDHSVFLAVGLAPSTRYYYVATAVDSSGNESAPSIEYSGSTNPPQSDGWPIVMEFPTVSSPAIGDIDGDGDLEIVQGNQKIYAWHHDGVELVDGDGDARSWGVLTTAGDVYVSPVALARVDGHPGLDIIAASRDTREVYVFDHEGNTLPGWPQSVENYIRAGLVAGDINGDGILEVVAVDEKGVLYVWNPNGTEYIDGDANPSTPGVFARLPGNSFLYTSPAVADIDGDDLKEIVIPTQGSELYVFNEDGSNVSPFPIAMDEPVCGSPAVGDIDDDDDLEIVVNMYNGRIRVYHHDGSTLWTKWYTNGLPFGPSPALGDITGDGKLETLIPAANGNLYAIDYNGDSVSGWPVEYNDHTYTESSPIIADVTGDGSLDVILGDETHLIRAWDSGGNLLDGFPLPVADAIRGVPAVDDMDGDGDVDLVAAGWDQFVYVWDLSGMFDRDNEAWPSFHCNSHNDGLYGSVIPTGIGDAAFSFDIFGDGVELVWRFSAAAAGHQFDISRAQTRNGATDAYGVVAARRVLGPDGELRFVDTDVEMGGRYVYRLSEAVGGEGVHITGEIYVPVTVGSLSQNYPNPFNPTTTITYYVPDGGAQWVRLVVYDVSGARVRTLADGMVPGGKYTVEWDGRNDQGHPVSSGVYFYRLVETSFTNTKKMLLLK
jgi:DNA-binding beta-propeller fold protein YncE